MAPEDRDPIFEKALAHHLRLRGSGPRTPGDTQQSAGAPGAGLAPGSSSQDDACPNPEVLAAYHERLLVSEKMATLKGHIAACERCQEILATLEATDDLLLPSDRAADEPTNNVVTMPAPHLEIPAEIIAATTAPAPTAVPSRAARRAQSSWRSKTLRGANWKWLAPRFSCSGSAFTKVIHRASNLRNTHNRPQRHLRLGPSLLPSPRLHKTMSWPIAQSRSHPSRRVLQHMPLSERSTGKAIESSATRRSPRIAS